MTRLLPVALVAALGAAPVAGIFVPVPLGPQQLANVDTNDFQDEVAVARSPYGRFVVVWRDQLGDGDASAILGRMFDARTGEPAEPFLVNFTTAGDQRNPAIAMGDDGRFVVVWEAPDTVDSGAQPEGVASPGLFASLREPDGKPVEGAEEFPVNVATEGVQRRAAVAMDANGGFLVVWQSDFELFVLGGEPTPPDQEIRARYFPPGFPESLPGSEFLVNVGRSVGDQERPAVASVLDGVYQIVWEGPWEVNAPTSVVRAPLDAPAILYRVLVFNSPVGAEPEGANPEQPVNASTSLSPRRRAAIGAHDFVAVVAWEEGIDGERDVVARRLVEGTPQAGDVQVHSGASGDQREPTVHVDLAGDATFVWLSEPAFGPGPDPEGSPIVIQGKKSSGGGGGGSGAVPEGIPVLPEPEFQVNSSGAGFGRPIVAGEPRGNFVVAWQGRDFDDPEDSGVYYRRFAHAIFVDGFEGDGKIGNYCAWSAPLCF